MKNDRYPEVYGKVMQHGVLAVSKPTSTQMVAQSLRVMCTMRERLRMMEGEAGHGGGQDFRNPSVQPCQSGCSSSRRASLRPMPQHRPEKQAMDNRVSKKQVAEEIIKIYA